MTIPHLINIAIHVLAGIAAMLIGFTILSKTKGTELHKKSGKIFCYLGLIVCGTAALGLFVFRFLPFFAVLTLLVSYQLVSGWRAIYTKCNGPSKFDAIWTMLAILITALLMPTIDKFSENKVIIFSTIGALAFVLTYDSIRWLFPRSWYDVLWRYEHSYKLLASLFGMLSSFIGNTVRIGQPWTQIIPSACGMIFISYFFYRIYREDKNRFINSKASQEEVCIQPMPRESANINKLY